MASALTMSSSTIPTNVAPGIAKEETVVADAPSQKTAKERVAEYFKDNPIMVKISWCESRFRQYDKDGNLFRGIVNDRDIGVMQINTDYHSKTAERMGIDLTTIDGNMAYAKYLYDKQGTAPWNSSSPCWRNEVAMK